VPHQFQSPILLKFHGSRIRAYFDPADSHCFATLVLAQAWQGYRAGEVIGPAPQVNRTTDYIRLAMGWQADGPGAGAAQLRASHTALRREVRGIVGPRSPVAPISESEERDGQGNLVKISRGTDPSPAAIAPDAPLLAPDHPIVFTTRTGKVARLPLSIRDELNARLRNGEMGKRLVSWLNSLPAVREILATEFDGKPISQGNLSNWKSGGFRDSLRQQTIAATTSPLAANRLEILTPRITPSE
jgi:hypothetical protein